MPKLANDPYQEGGRTLAAFLKAAKDADAESWKQAFRSVFYAAGRAQFAPVITEEGVPALVRLAIQAVLTGPEGRSDLISAAKSTREQLRINDRESLDNFLKSIAVRAKSVVTHVPKFANPRATAKPYFPVRVAASPFLSGSSVAGRSVTLGGNATEVGFRAFFETSAFVDGTLVNVGTLLASGHPEVINVLRELGASDDVLLATQSAFANRTPKHIEEFLNQVILPMNEQDIAVTPVMSVSMASFLTSIRAESDDELIPTEKYSVGGSNARNIAAYAMDLSGYQRVLSSDVPRIRHTGLTQLARNIHYPRAFWNPARGKLVRFLEVDLEGWRNKGRDRYFAVHLEQALSVIMRPLLELRTALHAGQKLDDATHERLHSPNAAPELKFVRGDALTEEDVEALTDKAMLKLTEKVKKTLPGEIYQILRAHVNTWISESL